MLESEIERKLIKPIRALGGLCLKLECPGYTGMPDRMILLPGGVIRFVETKQPGKKERARQRLVHGVLRLLGFVVYSTVDSTTKIDMIVEECGEAIRGKDL